MQCDDDVERRAKRKKKKLLAMLLEFMFFVLNMATSSWLIFILNVVSVQVLCEKKRLIFNGYDKAYGLPVLVCKFVLFWEFFLIHSTVWVVDPGNTECTDFVVAVNIANSDALWSNLVRCAVQLYHSYFNLLVSFSRAYTRIKSTLYVCNHEEDMSNDWY